MEIAETALLSGLIFFGARLVVQNFRVDGPSMHPTLADTQFLLVNKLAYIASTPARGDVVVFRSPRSPNEDLVKRVIALPGETIEIRDGFVYVGGLRLDESGYFPESSLPALAARTVPADAYFVMGDNRAHSRDSRSIGPIPRGAIVGRVWSVYWPPNAFGPLAGVSPTLEPAPQRAAAPATLAIGR
ncbi:MAG: signal peptidase I [Actinobacteria bacterium]|nr:signal peptidase I [Actinomycetota bacterium]